MRYTIMDAKKKAADDSGQAIFEFIIFLPFILMIYVMIIDIGNAINTSINQQKAARGYFFARTKWNSTMPKSRYDRGGDMGFYDGFSNLITFDFIGWNERLDGNRPVAACMRMQIPMAASEEAECGSYTDPTTQWIRVQSVFGVCGATYLKNQLGMARLEYNVVNDLANLLVCINQ